MAKKRISGGGIYIENVTFWLVVVIGLMVMYLYYMHFSAPPASNPVAPQASNMGSPQMPAIYISTESSDPRVALSNPFQPPLKHDAVIDSLLHTNSPGLVPINIKTSPIETSYTQVGILTKNERGNGEQMILPLMGKTVRSGRDKWQYYTMTNGAGSINTKLPVSVNGKSCTGEYGCDSISSGDVVYVDGYNDTFRATIYDNSLLRYLPL